MAQCKRGSSLQEIDRDWFQQTLANIAGVVAEQIFVKSQAAESIVGHGVCLGSL